ncbi:hypothetical protein [Thioalkalivibrio sp. ALJ8]|uniref:hypothetical protein n=1 Tax=Thioalkalivibrio sp. ALJ8 TaxID=1158757 RepID=UPI0003644217|nr:hypothetical protein [Thioalkalivibrio sp. ALJ8]
MDKPADLHLLHHALGISDPAYPDLEPYRNHFMAGPGHSDMPGLERLEDEGLMVRSTHPLAGGVWVFSATEEGRRIALETRPRLPKSKLRYRRYLNVRDIDPDLTFREFLSNPEFAHCR